MRDDLFDITIEVAPRAYYTLVTRLVNKYTATSKHKRKGVREYKRYLIADYCLGNKPCPAWLEPHIKKAVSLVQSELKKRGLSIPGRV
jgi:hypothetical protein